MSEFKIIDYSNWSSDLRKLAQKADNNDNTEGLSSSKEVIEFFNSAYENGYDTKSINELFGLEITANSAVKRRAAANNTEFSQYAEYFNSLDYIDRSNLIYSANNIGYEKLAELEKSINTAFEECKGYGLIKTRRDRFEDRTRFDIQEVHNDVQTALESINELQEKLEKAYDKAKGQTGSAPQYADYETRLKNIAFSTLGESYEDFIAHNNLDFTKTITEAEAYDPKYENSIVYGKARAYVNQIKKLAREELQRTRTESGERLLDETIKYSNSSVDMIDFESDDITADSITKMESAIMRQAFIEAITTEYQKTPVENTSADTEEKDGKYFDKTTKRFYIRKNGQRYNINGAEE